MCLAVIAVNAHPRYALVLAANRDEHHARPTAAAQWWPEGWLGGRDLRAHGTWLGVNRHGRFAFVTNVREPARNEPAAPSRGALVPEVLADTRAVAQVLAAPITSGAPFNGYNLVAGVGRAAWWTSNRATTAMPVALTSGVHGVSNAGLDTPWPKLVRTRIRLQDWCAGGDTALEPLFAALADRTRAADDELPATGVSVEWERLLSAPFIASAGYGTRSSTVLAIGSDGHVRFVEQSFDPLGRATTRIDISFEAAGAGGLA